MKLFSFFNKRFRNTAIVCIHGFGRSQTHEFDPLKEALSDYKFYIPELYDLRNQEDDDWTHWLSRAETVLDDLASQGKEIILIGYSMGGVIATYYANKANVKKLILLAPAYEYITLANAIDVFNNLIGRKSKEEDTSPYPPLPQNFTSTFTTLVSNCRDSISEVRIPTLMIHGEDDPTISSSTSRKYFKKVPATKKHLCVIEDVDHHILHNPKHQTFAIELIRSFIENKF